ncbi:hypothetical protein ACFWO6_30915, partial [Paenibacillus glucanolyticus]|uniref:hypothetical protein n=1 Tax=Paenibacillus glucanolyticus TaxID=59843 RepID=UPI003668FED4
AAAEHSIGLLTDPDLVARVGLVVAGTAYRAVLGGAGFVPAFVGGRGSGKTALALVCCQHFAGARLHRDMPFGVQMDPEHGSTAKAGQKWLHLAADVALVFDDFAPDHGPAQAARRMGQFVRAAYNKAARHKLNRYGDLIEGEAPRGVALVTAEMLPSTPSARERMLHVPSQWRRVDVPTVRRLQAAPAADARSVFLAGLVRWAARWDAGELAEWVRDEEAKAHTQLATMGFLERTCEHVARLYVGWRAAAQTMVDAGEVPADLVPTACGWRPGMAEGVFLPSGVRIGYVRKHQRSGELRLMLLPKAAAAIAAKAAEQAGLELGLTVPGISEAVEFSGVGWASSVEC